MVCGKAPSASSNVPSSLDPHECFYIFHGFISVFHQRRGSRISFPFNPRACFARRWGVKSGFVFHLGCVQCNLPRAQPVQRGIFLVFGGWLLTSGVRAEGTRFSSSASSGIPVLRSL